jgi:hypothetical protein
MKDRKSSMDAKEGVEPRPRKFLLVLVFLLWIESSLFPKDTNSSRPPWLDPIFLDSIAAHYLGLYPDGIFHWMTLLSNVANDRKVIRSWLSR